MSDKKAEENIERYLKTGIYTYAGAYAENMDNRELAGLKKIG